MGRSTFTGPILSGPIVNTSGTTLGKDVKDTGFIVLTQEVVVTQAGSAAALATNIVIPPNSTILAIRLFVTTPWDGVAATFNIGTSVAANQLAVASDAANTGVALGIISATPGANATRVGNWADVGTNDVRLWLLSTNTGAGVGRLSIQYGQSVTDA